MVKNMGDNITDLPKDCDVPPVPLKTYQWEDIRRQKLEGRYPWTHLYKPPFDAENWDKLKEHEYEIVVPMDSKPTTPSPLVKITADKEHSGENANNETEVTLPDTNRLRVPEDDDKYENDDGDSSSSDDEDLSEEITAAELQHRLEETYFHGRRCDNDEHEYELTETTRSYTPSTSGSKPQTPPTPSRHANKVDRIRQRFRAFRDQLAGECSPRPVKRKPAQKSASLPKKNKFNFRKRTATARSPDRTKSAAGDSSPSAPATPSSTSSRASRFSFPTLSTFSRSRSSSAREHNRSCSSESEQKKRFDFRFSTYPRPWSRRNRQVDGQTRPSSSPSPSKKSASTGSPSRKTPLTRRWFAKSTDSNVEKSPKNAKVEPAEIIVHESIFVSLHEDTTKKTSPTCGLEATPPVDSPAADKKPATNMKIDDENFIFISLHEERFPEKLAQREPQLTAEEAEIEREIKSAQTARKFQHMLWKLENDRLLRARRAAAAAAAADDQPEPVVITELTSGECIDDADRVDTITVETPHEDDLGRRISGENVPPDRFKFERAMSTSDAESGGSFRRRIIMPDTFDTPARPAVPRSPEPDTVESNDRDVSPPTKVPRKKSSKLRSAVEYKKSSSTSANSVYKRVVEWEVQSTPAAVEKTYIADSLEQISTREETNEPEHAAKWFAEYERALENTRSYSSFEIESSYSHSNTLARLETPAPPARPSRKGTLSRIKREAMLVRSENKENAYQTAIGNGGCSDGQSAYSNTFPISRGPDKPRRKLRCKRRTYSNSTNNTDVTDALENDTAIKTNIVHSKQLSVSFLPLSSNVVGEPITEYNLRETSSMIHLNIKDPPLPPKRRKSIQNRDNVDLKFNSLPVRHAYSSKASSIVSENVVHNLELNIETEIEYAEDGNSTVADSETPPKRPCRKRLAGPSIPDDDRTSREIESLPSELSTKEETDFCDSDSKDLHGGYAIIGRPNSRSVDNNAADDKNTTTRRRKSRRFSDFFTLPRIRAPTNYIQPISQTLNRRRLPSPTRPPRRTRKPQPPQESTYVNDADPFCEGDNIFDCVERLNFALATPDNDDIDEDEESPEGKDLRADFVLEKMKSRPLPPPPRPIRKSKEDRVVSDHYSQSSKKKSSSTNDLGSRSDEKILNTTTTESAVIVESKNWHTNECSNSNTRFETTIVTESNRGSLTVSREYTVEIPATVSLMPDRIDALLFGNAATASQPDDVAQSASTLSHCPTDGVAQSSQPDDVAQSALTLSHCPNDGVAQSAATQSPSPPPAPSHLSTVRESSASPSPCVVSQVRDDFQQLCSTITTSPDVINASRINVSELNVTKLNVGEIESNRLITSNIDSSTMQITNVRAENGNCIINSIDLPAQYYPANSLQTTFETIEPSLHLYDDSTAEMESSFQRVRSRFSSMVPEVGSDDETTSTKVVRPIRRRQSSKKELPLPPSPPAAVATPPQPSDTDGRRPTLSELMLQILQICHSSVGQAIHSLLEQFIPEDRDKRNEVQAAIWVVTIIVAGCLMLGLQTNEKVVHHHHWDFHFPPPH